jgi:hypothetical protein
MFASLTNKHMKTSTHKCQICFKKFTGIPYSLWPFKKNGICCLECNNAIGKIISEKIATILKRPNK